MTSGTVFAEPLEHDGLPSRTEVVIPESNAVVDREEQRETGAEWMAIGGICWLVAFIAMCFHPAEWKLGRLTIAEYAAVLAIIGVVVFVLGWRAKRKASG